MLKPPAPNSESNTFLGGLLDFQEGGPRTFIPVRVACKDNNLQDVCTGTIGDLLRPAKMTRGAKPGDQEWKIIVERQDFFYGGGTVFDL